MKRLIAIILAALMLLAFVSCGKPQAPSANENISTDHVLVSAKVDLTELKGVPMSLAVGKNADNGHDYGTWTLDASTEKLIPWVGNVVELAKAEQSLRFYFMAGEGVEIEGVQTKIGDGCLAVFPDGTTMLIDANQTQSGINDGYGPIMMANLERMGIDHLDYVLITHPHSDHYATFTNKGGIADTIPVGKLLYNGLENSNITNACSRNNIPMEAVQEGDVFDIGGVHIDILGPTAAQIAANPTGTEGLNNSSIIMLFNYNGRTALFTGDLYQAGMKDAVARYGSALDADVLKVCHHGHSETSIYVPFAEAVDPSLAAVSSGVPFNITVYKSYADTGAMVMNDYLDGYIVLTFTKDAKIDIRTSRERGSTYYMDLDKANYYADIYETPYVQQAIDGEWTKVNSIKALKKALDKGAKYIQVTADLDFADYDEYSPFDLNLDGQVIDFMGHRLTNLRSTTLYNSGTGRDLQYSSSSSLAFYGKDFTIRNAVMNNDYGAVAFSVNNLSADYRKPTVSPNVVFENITIENAGAEFHGCQATLIEFNATMPANKPDPSTVILAHRAEVTIESGSLINEVNGTQDRIGYEEYATVTIKNGVRVKGSYFVYIEDSRLNLEKSKVEY